ncbi:MAG: GNAT family N-acetyltransferase [Thermoplasmata archaeon]
MALEKNLEGKFWKHVNRDPLEYYFFILDWKFNRKDTKILLGLEDDAIEGMMLVYKDRVAQLRGSCEAIEDLLKHLSLEKVDLMIPRGCEDPVLRMYKRSKKYDLILMHLDKGKERLQERHEPVRPTVEDAEGIARVMRDTYPDFWGEETAETVRESLQGNFWLAVKVDGEVVSVGNTFFADFGSNIGVIATDKGHRNGGYATSIVSSLVREIFLRHDKALIHVMADNGPAVRVYQKVGFRPYNSYLLIKGKK